MGNTDYNWVGARRQLHGQTVIDNTHSINPHTNQTINQSITIQTISNNSPRANARRGTTRFLATGKSEICGGAPKGGPEARI